MCAVCSDIADDRHGAGPQGLWAALTTIGVSSGAGVEVQDIGSVVRAAATIAGGGAVICICLTSASSGPPRSDGEQLSFMGAFSSRSRRSGGQCAAPQIDKGRPAYAGRPLSVRSIVVGAGCRYPSAMSTSTSTFSQLQERRAVAGRSCIIRDLGVSAEKEHAGVEVCDVQAAEALGADDERAVARLDHHFAVDAGDRQILEFEARAAEIQRV